MIIEAVIDKDGSVRCARLVESVPFLDLAAYAAVRGWTFEPATVDGEPVSVIYNLTVRFGMR